MKIEFFVEMIIGYAEMPGTSWPERALVEGDSPLAGAQAVIDRFNATLRSNERPRALLSVTEVQPEPRELKHRWEKVSLVTEMDRLGMYDRHRCVRCGATGKLRYLGEPPIPDKKKDRGCSLRRRA